MLYPLDQIKDFAIEARNLTDREFFILEKIYNKELMTLSEDILEDHKEVINTLAYEYTFIKKVVIDDKEIFCLSPNGYRVLKAKQMVHKYN